MSLECKKDAACPASTPFCIAGVCGACRTDKDCKRGARCDKTSLSCVAVKGTPPEPGLCQGSVSRTCFSGPVSAIGVGPCKGGKQSCREGRWSACEGEVIPRKESCNGQDDDCDGTVDNAIEGVGDPCRLSGRKDSCAKGVVVCTGGKKSCRANASTAPEQCNNRDDDCDGAVDEDVTRSCYEGPSGASGVGACKQGTQTCSRGVWSTVCVGAVKPSKETCNEQDDDCDGKVDNVDCSVSCKAQQTDPKNCGACGNVCPLDTQCVVGACVTEPCLVLKTCVLVKAGTFLRGKRKGKSNPQVKVTLTRDFLVMRTEFTQGEYLALLGKNPAAVSGCGLNCPVERVNWNDAAVAANALSRKEKLTECFEADGSNLKAQFLGPDKLLTCNGWRLPTEAEWEYAARAGATGDRYGDVKDIAWYRDNSGAKLQPVGKKLPNAFGLYDMLGNVQEWTLDEYAPFKTTPQTNPANLPATLNQRVFRGGFYDNDVANVHFSYRYHRPYAGRYPGRGFRLVRTP